MNYKNYQKARDLSWQVLIDCQITTIPIPVVAICNHYKIPVFKFCDSEEFESEKRLNDGFAVNCNGNYTIFYNEKCKKERSRFIIAHELGHILLKHLETTENDQEFMANVFASRLLAPSCIIQAKKCTTIDEIRQTFNISREFAKNRLERNFELNKRGMFLSHPLEQKVYQQFVNNNFFSTYTCND